MELELNKPLAFFDLETTGLDIVKDRIVEISILKVFPNHKRENLYFLINPGMPIPPEVSAVHGIKDVDVKDCPKFNEIAKEIYDFIEDADLAGYNSNRFDIPMLVEEMLRCQLDIKTEAKNNVDVQTIFHTMEKRTLEAAYKFYCDKTLEGAHTAEADTLATYEVLKAQLDKYPEIKNDVSFISTTFGSSSDHVDTSKRIMKRGNDFILCFGKYKDKTFGEIARMDPSYFSWMYKADFGLHTKLKLKEICINLGIRIQ